MEQIHGQGVSSGMAYGRIYFVRADSSTVPETSVLPEGDTETERFRNACRILQIELHELYQKTRDTLGESEAEIFSVHQMMLEDDEYTELV